MIIGLFSLIFSSALAAVSFDPVSGTGFVGKGDVQLALSWNNKQLQDNAADVSFKVSSVSETTWECQRDGGTQTQERSRATTTSEVLSSIARERNQITGFNLLGFSGTTVVETDGPAIGSCPSGWSEVADSRQTEQLGGGGVILVYNGDDHPLE